MNYVNMHIIIYAIISYHFVLFVNAAECSGKYHSFPSSRILPRNLSIPFTQHFDKFPTKTTFENTGHAIIIRYKYERVVPSIQMESLHDKNYRFEFIQYNWLNKSVSSAFPAEIHMVFRNERYTSYEQALERDLGILILSYRHELREFPFSDMDSFYKALDNIVNPYTKIDIFNPHIMPLYHFGMKFSNYYMFVGRNIDPRGNCNTDVIWLAFPEGVLITTSQAEHFQNLVAFDGTALMSNNILYSSPNSSIYLAVDLQRFEKQGLVAEPFEGFGSASNFMSANLYHLLIWIFGFCM